MSWSPTLRHDFGLGKISSSLLFAVCLPHNNAFFNYFTLVLFPGAYMCSVPVGRELSLLAKSPEDAGPGWLEGWLSLPLLPPSTVHVVGFRGCSSVLGSSSKAEGFLIHKRLHKKKMMLTLTMSFSKSVSFWVLWAQALLPWSHPRYMCCFPLLCDCYMCSQDLLCQPSWPVYRSEGHW